MKNNIKELAAYIGIASATLGIMEYATRNKKDLPQMVSESKQEAL